RAGLAKSPLAAPVADTPEPRRRDFDRARETGRPPARNPAAAGPEAGPASRDCWLPPSHKRMGSSAERRAVLIESGSATGTLAAPSGEARGSGDSWMFDWSRPPEASQADSGSIDSPGCCALQTLAATPSCGFS